MAKTRKVRRGGGLFDFFSGSTPSPEESMLKARRNQNLRRAKSKVANVLSTPGEVKYTNKERIQAQYAKALEELKKIEKPAETASALRQLVSSLQSALDNQTVRQAGAVTITLPVGIAQLVVKALMIFLFVITAIFIDIPMMMAGDVGTSTVFLPNSGFNLTRKAYNSAKKLTGVKN